MTEHTDKLDILRAIKGLPEKTRLIIKLVVFERRTQKEVGEMLEISQPAVHQRLHTKKVKNLIKTLYF